MAPPEPTGTLTIDQGAGPFHYGDTLTFTTTSSNLRGGYPMVEVCVYQDVDGDGDIDLGLFEGDATGVSLTHPDRPVTLPPGHEKGEDSANPESGTDVSKPAKGWVRLLRYGWKGKQQYIDELDRAEFDVGP